MRLQRHREPEDGSAITELFADQYVALTRAAWLMLDDRAEAEDVVQEALTRLLTSRRKSRDVENAPAYLRSIVFNLARSRLRRRSTEHRRASTVAQRHMALHSAATRSPEEHAVQRFSDALVADALRVLPARQRECVVLRYYLELSEAEIARALGISKGSVKTHTSRAMGALRTSLGEGEP